MAQRVAFIVAELGADADPFMLHLFAALAEVQHLGWTKLNAIAEVLNGANADHWIEAASIHSRAEIKQLVQEHVGGFAGRKPEGSTATRVKTFNIGTFNEKQHGVETKPRR